MPFNPVSIAPWLDVAEVEKKIPRAKNLPLPRKEPWKYTSLKQVLERLDQPFEESQGTYKLNGRGVAIGDFFSQRFRELAEQYVGNIADISTNFLSGINLLHASFCTAVVCRAHSKDVVSTIHMPAADSCQRFLIVVEEHACLELLESTLGGNRVIECVIMPGGSLLHRRIQTATDKIEYNSLSVKVSEQANYQFVQYSVGAQLRRNDIVVNVEGEGAEVDISGGWKLNEKTHLDTQVAVNHLVRGTSSKQKFHGVVGDSARTIFNGRIYIDRHAVQTDAQLQNKNISISDNASIYTKPELEIYADDVTCSHGATAGQLDEQQLFYLRTRGIPADISKELILEGFLKEIVEHESGASLLGVNSRASN